MTREIPLTQGMVALIDNQDFDLVRAIRWFAIPTRMKTPKWYAWGYVGRGAHGRRRVSMHRLILQPNDGLEVDHINGDSLDNRRVNLRPATRSQNLANRPSSSKSGYRGVFLRKGRYDARIAWGGKIICLGRFDAAEDAARAYDEAAWRRSGEFSRLNFPRIPDAA
ncbi:MAG: HNH endonuclease [Trueperaceae bacterium]